MVAKATVDPILLKIRQAAAKKLLDMYGSIVGFNKQSYTINLDSKGMPILDDSGQVSVTNTATGSKTNLPTENLVFQDPSHISYTDAKGATHVFDPSGGGAGGGAPAAHHGLMDYVSMGSSTMGAVGQVKSGFGGPKNIPAKVPTGPNLFQGSQNDLGNADQLRRTSMDHFNETMRSTRFPGDFNSDQFQTMSPSEFGRQARSIFETSDNNLLKDLTDNLNAKDINFRNNESALRVAEYNWNHTGDSYAQLESDYKSAVFSKQNQINTVEDEIKKLEIGKDTNLSLNERNSRIDSLKNEKLNLEHQRDFRQQELDRFIDQGPSENAANFGQKYENAKFELDKSQRDLDRARQELDAYNKSHTPAQQRADALEAAYQKAQQSHIEQQIMEARHTGLQKALTANTDKAVMRQRVDDVISRGGGDPVDQATRSAYDRAKIEEGLAGKADSKLTNAERNRIAGRMASTNADYFNNTASATPLDWTVAQTDEGLAGRDPSTFTQDEHDRVAARLLKNKQASPDRTDFDHEGKEKYYHEVRKGMIAKALIAGAAAFGLEKSFESIFNSKGWGWDRTKAMLGAITTGTTMIAAMHSLHQSLHGLPAAGFLQHLHTNPITRLLTSNGGIIATTVAVTFVAWMRRDKKSDEEIALAELKDTVAQTVWYDGPVLLLTSGIALASMGINLGPSSTSLMQTMTVPQVTLDKALGPQTENRYGTLFVQQGTGGQATRVMYLTPGGLDTHGNIMDVVHVTTLGKGMIFGDPGNGAYIPFFVKGADGKNTLNPQATACIQFQADMVRCAVSGKVTTMTGAQCAAQGGACSHVAVGGS